MTNTKYWLCWFTQTNISLGLVMLRGANYFLSIFSLSKIMIRITLASLAICWKSPARLSHSLSLTASMLEKLEKELDAGGLLLWTRVTRSPNWTPPVTGCGFLVNSFHIRLNVPLYPLSLCSITLEATLLVSHISIKVQSHNISNYTSRRRSRHCTICYG